MQSHLAKPGNVGLCMLVTLRMAIIAKHDPSYPFCGKPDGIQSDNGGTAIVEAKEYSGDILKDAQRVLDIKTYSYKKGNATLLDVRQAESDLTTTYQNFYSSLNEEAKALVNLEQMTGFWDIHLD